MTVDLLTTGIDVRSITNLVFIRRVSSRILYEQMLGRATRICPEIGKETFRIFDAVDLYRNLQDVTAMKPVVVNPQISLSQLFEELANASNEEQRSTIRDQLIVKLRQRLKKLSDQSRAQYEAHAGSPRKQRWSVQKPLTRQNLRTGRARVPVSAPSSIGTPSAPATTLSPFPITMTN